MSDAPERIWAFYAPHIAEDENGATIVAHETVQYGAAEYVRANMQPTVSPELLATTNDVAALVEALEWYISEDETNEGDEPMPDHGNRSWDEINSYWIEGKRKAEAALARVKSKEGFSNEKGVM